MLQLLKLGIIENWKIYRHRPLASLLLQLLNLGIFVVAVVLSLLLVYIEDCVVLGIITHPKSTSNATTNGSELEKAEPSRHVSGVPCTMKAQPLLSILCTARTIVEKYMEKHYQCFEVEQITYHISLGQSINCKKSYSS